MIWNSAAEFWAMGGYGVYVWGSMGVSAALMVLEVWLARVGRRQALDAVCEAMDATQEQAHEHDGVAPTASAPSRAAIRSRNSLAALRLYVRTRMRSASVPASIRCATASTKVAVLPVPGPANTSMGP